MWTAYPRITLERCMSTFYFPHASLCAFYTFKLQGMQVHLLPRRRNLGRWPVPQSGMAPPKLAKVGVVHP
eukprot:scaffold104106_cov36-Tisochrysis_lutea.AAC.1